MSNFHYSQDTPEAVKLAINKAYAQSKLIRIFYGESNGVDWCEENDTIGFIGRSTGSLKIPLLLAPRCNKSDSSLYPASEGDAIMLNCIIKIIDVQSERVLYQAANYQTPEFSIKTISHAVDGLTHKVIRSYSLSDNQHAGEWGRFQSFGDACEYVSFLTGARVARSFSTSTLRNCGRSAQQE